MKAIKKLVLVLTALCLVFGIAACRGDDAESGKVTYTVNINCSDEAVLSGITVKLLDSNGKDVTDGGKKVKDGKVSFNVRGGTYSVVVDGIPSTHKVNSATLTSRISTTTLTIQAKDGTEVACVNFELTLLDDKEDPVPNALLNMCVHGDNGTCTPGTTNSEGKAVFYNLVYGQYDVHLASGCPNGYLFDDARYVLTVDESHTKYTVNVEKPHTYTVTVKYAAHKDNDGNAVAETPAEGIEIVFKRLYSVLANPNDPRSAEFFYAEAPSAKATTNANGVATIVAAKKDSFYATISNVPDGYWYEAYYNDRAGQMSYWERENERTFTLTKFGAIRDSRINIQTGSTPVTVNKSANEYWFELDAQRHGGRYSVETTGSLDTYAERWSGSSGTYYQTVTEAQKAEEDPDGSKGMIVDTKLGGMIYNADKSENDKNFYMEFTLDPQEFVDEDSGNSYAFKIGANTDGVTLPASFNIVVTLIEAMEPSVVELTYPEATQVKTAIDTPSGTMKRLDPATSTVVKGDDGLYHVGAADGPVVFVPITGTQYGPNGWVGEGEDPTPTSIYYAYLTSNGAGWGMSDGETYNYDYDKFIKAYAAAANEDGLTPLTEEFKDYMQAYAKKNGIAQLLEWDTESEDLYMFACIYFE